MIRILMAALLGWGILLGPLHLTATPAKAAPAYTSDIRGVCHSDGNIWIPVNGKMQWTGHTCTPGAWDADGNPVGDDRDVEDEKTVAGYLPIEALAALPGKFPTSIDNRICLKFVAPDAELVSDIKNKGVLDVRYEGPGWARGKKIHGFKGVRGGQHCSSDVRHLLDHLSPGEEFEISIQGIKPSGLEAQPCRNQQFNSGWNNAGHYPNPWSHQTCTNGNNPVYHAFFHADSRCDNRGTIGLKCWITVQVCLANGNDNRCPSL